jgi:hypothetical protein
MKLLSRIIHENSKKDSKKDPKDVDRGSYYLMCTQMFVEMKSMQSSISFGCAVLL